MATTGAYINSLPFCCGVLEAGSFRHGGNVGDIGAENAELLLKKILDRHQGYPIIFNFKREIDHDDNGNIIHEEEDYTSGDLRQAVMKHPNAVNIATFINPNSGNRVDSWVIFEGEIPYEPE